MTTPYQDLERENRPHRMPQDRRSTARTTSSTPRSEPRTCGSRRSHGKRQTVSHSSLDGADAAHRLHRHNGLSLNIRLDKNGGSQAS